MRRRIGIIIVGLLVVVIALFSYALPIRQDELWCDAVSGSKKVQTRWIFGFVSGVKVYATPLEARLHAIGFQWSPDWRYASGADLTIWGRPTAYGVGSLPPIWKLIPGLGEYVSSASDQDLRRLAQTLRSGTREQQQAAVDAAFNKSVKGFAAKGPGE